MREASTKCEVSSHARLRVGLRGGAVAGLVGGAVLTLVRVAVLSEIALLASWLSPSPRSALARSVRSCVWVAFKFPAFPFVGQRSLDPGFQAGVVALGLVTHFVVAIALGMLFGVAVVCRSARVTVALGLVWGFFAALASAFGLSRLIGGGPLEYSGALVLYLVYGLALAGAFLRYERRRIYGAPR